MFEVILEGEQCGGHCEGMGYYEIFEDYIRRIYFLLFLILSFTDELKNVSR